MRRILSLLLLGSFAAVSAFSQGLRLLPAGEASAVLERADRLNRSMVELKCDFLQTRTSDMLDGRLVSTGRIRIVFPSGIEYEMITPYASKLSFDDRNAVVKQVMKLFSGGLSTHRGFSMKVSEGEGEYVLAMIPEDPQMQDFLKAVIIHLAGEDMVAVKVEIRDADDGVTVMEFMNVEYR